MRCRLCSTFVVGLLLLFPRCAMGLDIQLQYMPGNNSENPAFDPIGIGLFAQLNAAANHWESIITTNHTLTIQFWYDDLDETTLADAKPLDFTDNRVTLGRIRFDTRDEDNDLRPWWFDNTPSDDSEFNMTHHPYSVDGSSSHFIGTPLDGLEVGYRGFAPSGPANGSWDVQSTALHEIGHLLGLASSLPDAVTETGDGTYDLPPSQMNGNTAEVRHALGDIAHIRPNLSLMCTPCGALSVRRRPSAVDMLAAATVGNWNLDFPRKMFVDGKNFNAASGWLDSQPPNSSDDAYVAAEGSFNSPVELTANDTVGTLTLLDTYLSTGSHRLTVNGLMMVDENGTFRVPAGGELVAPDLWVKDGNLSPGGGLVNVSGTVTIDDDGVFPADSNMQGNGTIRVGTGFVNEGMIRTSGGTLILTSPSALDPPLLDLDGLMERGEVDVSNGDLIVERGLTDPFDDRITIGDDDTATFMVPWIVGTGGELRRSGLGGGVATLAGAEVTVQGEVVGSHLFDITAPIVFESTSELSWLSGEPPILYLSGDTTYRGPNINPGGHIIQNGDAFVEATTVIDPDFYDWDGEGAPSDTTVTNAVLQISSPQIESGDPTLNGYGGTATLINAALLVTTDAEWRLDGTIEMMDGTVRGRGVLNHGNVRGDGLVISATFTNDGSVVGASGGTLTLMPLDAFPDLDGAGGNGALRATGGDIYVPDDNGALFAFTGVLSISDGYEYRMDHHGLHHLGSMSMSGGRYVAPEFVHEGSLTVRNVDSTLETVASFEDASTSQLINANLVIDGHATFYSLASMTGSGALEILKGSHVDGEAELDVPVINRGELAPGFSAGSFVINEDYTQTFSGELFMEIGGLTPGTEHDELVASNLDLAGELIVSLIGGHMPAAGAAYDLLDFNGAVGTFDTLTFEPLPFGLLWDTSMLYVSGELLVVEGIAGDYNDDGVVNSADYVVWRNNLGAPEGTLPNDTAGGDIGAAQYDVWKKNFGAVLPAAVVNSRVPEPSALVLLALAAMAAGVGRVRRLWE